MQTKNIYSQAKSERLSMTTRSLLLVPVNYAGGIGYLSPSTLMAALRAMAQSSGAFSMADQLIVLLRVGAVSLAGKQIVFTSFAAKLYGCADKISERLSQALHFNRSRYI